MNFYYVYILLSQKDDQFYIGFSTDVYNRANEHNSGKNISTAKRAPLDLVYFEAFLLKTDALRREKYFKTTKGKVTLRQMLREFFKNRLNKK